MADGEVPGFFKVWGVGDDVWVVGAAGTVLHRNGAAPFAVVPTGAKDTLFTVSGTGDRAARGRRREQRRAARAREQGASDPARRLAACGGAHPGRLRERSLRRLGERRARRRLHARSGSDGAFVAVDHGLPLPATSSLHSIFVDPSGRRLVGRRQRAHAGARRRDAPSLRRRRAPVAYPDDDDAAPDAGAPVGVPRRRSSPPARADRSRDAGTSRSSPRSASTSRGRRCTRATCSTCPPRCGTRGPAYDTKARGVFVRERHTARRRRRRHGAPRSATPRTTSSRTATRTAIGGTRTLACLRAVMGDLGYDPDDAHDTGDDPIAFGNRIGARDHREGRPTTARTKPTTTPTPPATRRPTRPRVTTTPARR